MCIHSQGLLGVGFHNNHKNYKKMEKIEVMFCTTNTEKLNDLKYILGDQFEVKNIDIELTEIQGSPNEIAIFKSKEAFNQINKPLIVEDTALCFNSFKGLPGPYVKHFLKSIGVEGLYKMLHEFKDKSGYCLSTFGYVDKNGVFVFEGKTDGTIVSPRPPVDLGWNSIFVPEGSDKTFSQMSFFEKNQISHRYKAGLKLKEFLLKNNEERVNNK